LPQRAGHPLKLATNKQQNSRK